MLVGVLTGLLSLVAWLHPPASMLIRPQQVRIAWTERQNEISVMWTSWLPLALPQLQYSTSGETRISVTPETSIFFKNLKYDIFFEVVYTAIITQLQADVYYEFRVGQNPHFWSSYFSFRGLTPSYNTSTLSSLNQQSCLAVLGDMGIGPYSIPTRTHLLDLISNRTLDGVIHLGDIGYDLERHMGGTADKFLREIEPIAGQVPYMVIPGNHEHRQNFTHYSHLFRMPRNAASGTSNFFYSFDLGRAHFIAINAEAYFYLPSACAQTQYNWLEEDLQAANARRDLVPWIFVFSHKPLYCQVDFRRPMEESKSFKCNYDCDHECKLLRGEWEDLFNRYSVDIIFGAHMHDYERELPIYHNLTIPSELDLPHFHRNPNAQISILTGTAGSDHLHDALSSTKQLWNAAYTDAYGFGLLYVYNSSYIRWEEWDSERRVLVDYVEVEKTRPRYIPIA